MVHIGPTVKRLDIKQYCTIQVFNSSEYKLVYIIFNFIVLKEFSLTIKLSGTDGDDLELDPDIRIPLSDEEAEIQSFLLNGENLSDETLQKYMEPFWSSEPYK